MTRTIELLLGAAAILAAMPAAHASDFGDRASASMTITVTIPPFLAALAAQRDGAVGLWTVTDDRHALMVKTPDEITLDEEAEAAIYHGPAMQFTVAADASAPFAIRPSATTSDNGLKRRGYRIAPIAVPGTAPSAASILVSAI